MKIAISAGGRFHALHLAHQLHKRKSLTKLFSFSYTKNDHTFIPATLVSNNRSCMLLDTAFTRLKLSKIITPSSFNVFKDNLFDHQVSKKIQDLGNLDLFVGWAHYLLKSIPAIRKTGAKIIVESGSCHISTQQKLLQEEYAKVGLTFAPITKENVAKMLAEYEQADYIMTLSEFARQSFVEQGIDAKKILKMQCGSDVEYFMKNDGECFAKQSEAKSIKPPSKFTVIFVGMMSVRKGIHYLLQAWNSLQLPEDKTQLILVGTMQKDLQQIRKNIPIKNNIVFYGATDRATLRTLYHQSSIFVLPSVEDGFGMVMGEAMASRLPIICTTNTGGTEIIEQGKEGFIVQACSSDALADKIAWCYANQKQAAAMGMLGQKKIQQFTWDKYGEQVFNIYKKIVEKT